MNTKLIDKIMQVKKFDNKIFIIYIYYQSIIKWKITIVKNIFYFRKKRLHLQKVF